MPNHGHVVPNPDGSKARCGGPGLCDVCSKEKFEGQEKLYANPIYRTGKVAGLLQAAQIALEVKTLKGPDIAQIILNEAETLNKQL